jgi:aldose 1-epimerase
MHATRERWGQTPDVRWIDRYTLRNDAGMTVQMTNLGASVLAVEVPDRDGQPANVNLVYDSPRDYVDNSSYFGAAVGRYGNRIARGRFMLDGQEYTLVTNNGPNHLHGGVRGFTHQLWQGTLIDEVKLPGQSSSELVGVGFHYQSPAGEEGYPGTLNVYITYALHRDNRLTISYEAETDAPTVVNLTNHCYWNLAGAGSGNVLGHELQIEADEYLAYDANVLVTGEVRPVASTPFDFTSAKPIGADIDRAGGYDLCYVIRGWDQLLRRAATVREPQSGRVMEVWTTEPGVQLYTAEHFDGGAGCAGHGKRHAFCLECQHFPDAPNLPHFPSTVLRPGETYRQVTEHRFTVHE